MRTKIISMIATTLTLIMAGNVVSQDQQPQPRLMILRAKVIEIATDKSEVTISSYAGPMGKAQILIDKEAQIVYNKKLTSLEALANVQGPLRVIAFIQKPEDATKKPQQEFQYHTSRIIFENIDNPPRPRREAIRGKIFSVDLQSEKLVVTLMPTRKEDAKGTAIISITDRTELWERGKGKPKDGSLTLANIDKMIKDGKQVGTTMILESTETGQRDNNMDTYTAIAVMVFDEGAEDKPPPKKEEPKGVD